MKKKLPWIIVLILLILLALGGWYFYRMNAFKSALKPLAEIDNQLFEELITLTRTLPRLPLTTVSQRASDNIQIRNDISNKVKSLKPGIFKAEVKLYLQLLEHENNYARSLVELKRVLLEAEQAKNGEMVEEEVEEVRQVGKKSVVYRQKIFKRDLRRFKSTMDRKRDALARHAEVFRKLQAFEIKNSKRLSRIMPPRDLLPQLEEANQQLY